MMKISPIFVLIVAMSVSSTAISVQPRHGFEAPAMLIGMDGNENSDGTATYVNHNATNAHIIVIEGVQMNINGTTNRTIIMTLNTTATGNINRTNMDSLMQMFKQQVKVCEIGVNGSTNGTANFTYNGMNMTHVDSIVIVGFQLNANGTTNRTIALATNITANVSDNIANMDNLDNVMGTFKEQLKCFHMGGNWSTNRTNQSTNGTTNCTLSSYKGTKLHTVLVMVLHMNVNETINTTITATTNITNSGNNTIDACLLDDSVQVFKDQIKYFHMHRNESTKYNSSGHNDTDVCSLDTVLIAGLQLGKNRTAERSFIVMTNTTNRKLNATHMNNLLETFKNQLNMSKGSIIRASNKSTPNQNCSSVNCLQHVLQVHCQLIERIDLARNGTNTVPINATIVDALNMIMSALSDLNRSLLLGVNGTIILPVGASTSARKASVSGMEATIVATPQDYHCGE